MKLQSFSVYFRGLFYYWPTPIVLPPNGWPQARWRITAHERRSGVLGGVTTRHHGVTTVSPPPPPATTVSPLTTRHHPPPPATGRHRAVTGRHLRQTLSCYTTLLAASGALQDFKEGRAKLVRRTSGSWEHNGKPQRRTPIFLCGFSFAGGFWVLLVFFWVDFWVLLGSTTPEEHQKEHQEP